MKNPIYAKAVSEPYFFGGKSRWIRAVGAEKYAEQMFRKTFFLENMPKKAVLLAMAANHAEIYINGEPAVVLSVRSYIFDQVYEVSDILPYLREGKNVIAVVNIDTGEAVRAGFALEIQADGKTVCLTDETWVYQEEKALLGPVNYYISGGGEEIVNAAMLTEGFAEIDFDESDWKPAETIGGELLHAPYTSFHQSEIKAQTADVHLPKTVSALMLAKSPKGYPMQLGPSNQGVTCVMTQITAPEDTEMTVVVCKDLRSVSIDGEVKPLNQPFRLAKGSHFCVIAFAWTAEFMLQTKAALSFASPLGDGAPMASYLIATPPTRYPWNEPKVNLAVEEKVKTVLAYASFEVVPDEIKAALVPTQYTAPASVLFDIRMREHAVPADGFAEPRVWNDARITRCEGAVNIEGLDSLCGNSACVRVSPHRDAVNFVLDFGVEQVGRFAFEVDAPEGTVIEMHGFEMITDGGIKHMSKAATMRYICKEGKQSYIARRLRGFRYISVYIYGHTSDVVLKDIHVIENRYPMAGADFTCSDEMINRVYQMCIRTAEVCSLDLYVDCPGYEQNAWTGDARVTATVNLLNFGAFEFDKQYLRLIAQSIEDGLWLNYRTRNPRYINHLYLPCACFPTYPEGCIPVWSFMWLLQVYDHYKYTGDLEFLAEMFGAVRETLARCEKMTNSRGLFDMQGAWNLLEWANNDLDFYGEVTGNNVMLSHCYRRAAEMAGILGDLALSVYYNDKATAYRDAVNTYCWDDERKAYVDTVRDPYAYERYCDYMDSRKMPKASYEDYLKKGRIGVQSNTLALIYGCVPLERRPYALRWLEDNMESGVYVSGTPANRTAGIPSEEEAPDGYVHIGSPFFLYFALKTLYKFGREDLAILAQRRDWANLLESDLTTCIETFKSGKDWTRSVAHAWSASPAIFLMTEVLGIQPTKAGYTEFIVKPQPSGLDFAKGSVPTPYGRIYVEWKKKENGELEIICNAPENCKRIL
ncbi:MAG: family 78 glycoside hydrolase catalytic domain [Clostridia bacterium]|nr:family 78 glycoside hydrolase catalytic domain [Clostridia bacterium]